MALKTGDGKGQVCGNGVYLFSDTRVECEGRERLDNLLERHDRWLQVPAIEDEVRFRIELLQRRIDI